MPAKLRAVGDNMSDEELKNLAKDFHDLGVAVARIEERQIAHERRMARVEMVIWGFPIGIITLVGAAVLQLGGIGS